MKLKTMVATALLVAASYGVSAQTWVEGIYNPNTKTESVERSRLRFNEAFTIPIKKSTEDKKAYALNVYSFQELSKSGFFGRAFFKAPIVKGLSGRLDTKHVHQGEAQLDNFGLGVSYALKAGNFKGEVKVVPLNYTVQNGYNDAIIAGASLGYCIPINEGKYKIDVSAFGEIDVNNGKFIYGEGRAGLSKKDSKLSVSAGADFVGDGDLIPKVHPAVSLNYKL